MGKEGEDEGKGKRKKRNIVGKREKLRGQRRGGRKPGKRWK